MGDYDARLNEMKEQLKTAAVGADERVVRRLEDALSQWGNERESMLDDLVDHVDRASATNKGTSDRWKSRIDSGRQKVGSLLGEAVKDQMLSAGLQLFWAKALELENAFLENLNATTSAKLLDDLHAHQDGLGKMIAELADKWRYLLQQDQAIETDEMRVIDEIDRLIQDVLWQVTPIKQKLLDASDAIEEKAHKVIEELGEGPAAEITAEVINRIFGTQFDSTTVEAGAPWLATKVNELEAKLSQHERNVRAYRDLLAREKGTVLAVFKQNREQVDRYMRENAVENAKVWRDQAVGQLEAWAGARATSGQQQDANTFANKIETAVNKVWDQTEDFDEQFRKEFEGLFWGSLRSERIEELIEEAKFNERTQRLPARATIDTLTATADMLDDGGGKLADKALAPLRDLPDGLTATARELVLLRDKELRDKLSSTLESQFRSLLPVIADLRKMFDENRLRQDLGREELKSQLS